MAWWEFWKREGASAEAGTEIGPKVDPQRFPVAWQDDDPDFFWTTRGGLAGRSRGDAVPAAFAAINILTGQMSLLQPTVHERELRAENHRLTMLLRFPNRTIDPQQFWKMTWRPYFSQGNSYTYIRRDFQSRPVELIPATCIDAEFVDSRFAPFIKYRLELLGADVRGGLTATRMINTTSRDVIALHGMGFDGLSSPSPVQYAAKQQLQTMYAIGKHERDVIRDGINTGTVVTVDGEAVQFSDPEAWAKLVDRVKKGMEDSRKNGKVPLLPPGVKLDRLNSISNVDLQLIELLRWGVEDIARVWNISPVRLGHYHEGMRVAGMEAQMADFEKFTLAEHVKAGEAQFTRKLLTAAEIIGQQEIKIPTDSLKMGSLSERAVVSKQMVADGGMWTINEGRELTGKPPHPDGDRLLEPKGAPAQNGAGGGNQEDD